MNVNGLMSVSVESLEQVWMFNGVKPVDMVCNAF